MKFIKCYLMELKKAWDLESLITESIWHSPVSNYESQEKRIYCHLWSTAALVSNIFSFFFLF